MDKIPYNPNVLLRCPKCQKKTPHVLVDFSNDPTTAVTMFYECQDCGETKKVFDLSPLSNVTIESTKGITIEQKEERPTPTEKEPQIQQSA